MMRRALLSALLLSAGLSGPQAAAQAPVARTNWAVTRVGGEVFAFYGLGAGKTSADIARDVHALDLKSGQWRKVGDLPVTQGRLASAAVTVAGKVYVIGGYTVSPTGEEVSTPEVLRFDPAKRGFAQETSMPVPVDDSVAMVWRERWIVLVSGWHDTGNVSAVQFYDTQARRWSEGTPWPGAPVFGHAGGLTGDVMAVCDGVTSTKSPDGKNQFALSDECWEGRLSEEHPGQIAWRRLPAHPGAPLYRAGATGADAGRILFAGGSNRPYNYNGIGYDHQPSEPSQAVFSFDAARGTWQQHAPLPEAGMDFRGLIPLGEGAYGLFGGMRAGQQVSAGVIRFTPR